MKPLRIFKANTLEYAAHRQESMPDAARLSEQQINAWRELESALGESREYFNGDDGNVWMIADSLFLHKVSVEKPIREKVRIVCILREEEAMKVLVFDSEMFDDTDEHRSYARKNNLLLA